MKSFGIILLIIFNSLTAFAFICPLSNRGNAILPNFADIDYYGNEGLSVKNNKKNSMLLAMSSSSYSDQQLQLQQQYSVKQLISLGMQRFKKGDVLGSIEAFNAAENKDPSIRPYLWQRGLSYYYADMFQLGSDQFRYDVSVNPLDVEEIVWDIACLGRLEKGNKDIMALPQGKKDRRKIMATVYSLYRGDGATEQDLANFASSNESDEFYANFYLGLYSEACTKESAKASHYMQAAASSRYAKGIGAADYMTSCAKLHCFLRGWQYA